jgi:hypothetical protein
MSVPKIGRSRQEVFVGEGPSATNGEALRRAKHGSPDDVQSARLAVVIDPFGESHTAACSFPLKSAAPGNTTLTRTSARAISLFDSPLDRASTTPDRDSHIQNTAREFGQRDEASSVRTNRATNQSGQSYREQGIDFFHAHFQTLLLNRRTNP